MMFLRRLAALLALTLAAAGGAAAPAAATAPPPPSRAVVVGPHTTVDLATGLAVAMAPQLCEYDHICGWDYAYGPLILKTFVENSGCQTAPIQNRISYVSNRTDFKFTVWISSTICSGGTTGPLYAWNTGAMAGGYDNSIDSWKRG